MEKKRVRILVGNSSYEENSGFGYSALKVKDLKDNQLKELYKGFSEIAFIPKFEGDFPNDSFKYLDIISFRRLYFLLFGNDFSILNESADDIAKKFTSKDIYLVNARNSNTNKDNKDNLKNLVKNIITKYGESYTEIYILYLGNEAKKLMSGLEGIEEYFLYHPAYNNKKASSLWINYDDENSGKIKDKFRIV